MGHKVEPPTLYHGREPKSYLGWVVIGPLEPTIRAFRRYHPAARVHMVTHRGRTVWMTDHQYAIWVYIRSSQIRNRLVRMADIADRVHCSKATVSRFLRRLDLWRFIDLATLVGRKGGTWIKSRRAPSTTRERDAWLAGAGITWASRKIARDILAAKIRRNLEHDAQVWRDAKRTVRRAASRPVVRVQQIVQLTLEGSAGRA